jgi:hypothetical protein
MDTIELNIALVPDNTLDGRLVTLSKQLAAAHPALVQLDPGGVRLGLAPHLTLYQVPLPIAKLVDAHKQLQRVVAHWQKISLAATEYAYNQDEGSFEVRREKPPTLINMQNEVIATLNPLRGELLLERDPAGNSVRATLGAADTNEIVRKNLQATGYGEAGELFRPHDTTNWFAPGMPLDISSLHLPELHMLDGTYVALCIFALGPRGTCVQLLASCPLT